MTDYHTAPASPRGSKRFLNVSSPEAMGDNIVCVGEVQIVGDQHGDFYHYDVEALDNQQPHEDEEEQRQHYFDVETLNEDTEIPFAIASVEPLLPESAAVSDDDNSGSLSPAQRPEQHEHGIVNESVAAHPIVDDLPSLSSVLRPEFLFVNAIKPTPDSPIGLTFKKKKGAIYISHIQPGGLFHRSGLQAGDRVVAVNNVNCIVAPLRAVRDVVEKSKSLVSLCVRNKHGDPHTVLSSIQKPSRETKLGITFQMKRGALTVSRVKKGSLFEKSLLMPDHRCFFINGVPCDNMGSHAAADLTAGADRVTIISRARGDLATVLSVGEVSRRWSAVAVGAGVAAAALITMS